MKIKSMSLRGFRSHKETEIKFTEPVTVVVGDLGAGKSSIFLGIEVALTGQCDYYRSRTSDPKSLIHNGEGKMEIILDTEEGRIRRGRTDAEPFIFWKDVRTGVVKEIEAIMLHDMQVSKATVSALMNTTNFLEQEPAAQRELILAVIGTEFTMETLRELYTGDPLGLNQITGPVDSLGAIDGWYKTFYEERTVVNRRLKELKPLPPPTIDPPMPVEMVKTKLAAYEADEKTLIARVATLKAENPKHELQITTQQLTTLEGELGKKPKDETASLDKEVKKNEARQAELLGMIATIDATILDKQALLKNSLDNYNLLRNFSGKCVAGDHACPAEPGLMKTAGLKMQQSVKEATADVERAKKQRDEAQTALREIQKLHFDLASATQNATRAAIKWEEKERLCQELKDKITALKAKAKTPNDEELETAEKTLADVQRRIQVGKGKLEESTRYDIYMKQINDVAEKRRQLEEQSRLLEELVEFFGPKGVKTKLVDERIAVFAEEINKYLCRFGFQMEFRDETIYASAPSQPRRRPLSALSRSERWRLGVAIQISIAKFTGFNFVVVDNAELLNAPYRKELVMMLSGAALDQALVAWSLTNIPLAEFEPPRVPGVQFLGVVNENGVSAVKEL